MDIKIAIKVLSALFCCIQTATSPPIDLPSDAGIVDVTQSPYKADKTGIADATAAIQQALDDHANANRIIFLPAGEYTISNTLRWGDGAHGGMAQKRTTLMGAGIEFTTLKLAATASGYSDPLSPKAMIWTGNKPAQRFGNEIFHMTIHTNGHAGATGVQFNSSNFGSMEHVLITSGSPGVGKYGLDMGFTDEIGPLLIRNVSVDGFEVGIRTFWQVNSITFENITLRNQSTYGIHNYHQIITVRNLDFEGSVPAVFNQKDARGTITLVDCTLKGIGEASAGAAIHNQKNGFFRNITVSGFGRAVNNDDKGRDCGDIEGPVVTESQSHCQVQSLFESDEKTLNLPVKEAPSIPWPPVDQWANVRDFGAKGDGSTDDTKVVQDAVNAGKKVVYFPGGYKYMMNGVVEISGPVERVCGLRASLKGTGRFKVVDKSNDAPVVVIDGFRGGYQIDNVTVEHASSRTVLMAHCGDIQVVGSGTGDLFINDIVTNHFPLTNGAQHVWCRQLNIESDDKPKLINNGATLWILGLKTERGNVVVKTENGGQSEILGGHIYSTTGEKTHPMFEIVESAFSVAGLAERNFNGYPYQTWITETQSGVTKTLAASEVVNRGNFYYTSYSRPGNIITKSSIKSFVPYLLNESPQHFSLMGQLVPHISRAKSPSLIIRYNTNSKGRKLLNLR